MTLKLHKTVGKFKAGHITLKTTEVEDTNGKVHLWDWVQRNGTTKAVAIVPLYWNEERSRAELVVLKQFRVPINDYIIELPAGLVDKEGEEFFDVAERELLEETGLVMGLPIFITPQLYTSPGLTDESISYVVAHVFGDITNKNCGLLEDISVLSLSVDEVKEVLVSDNKIDAKCWVWLNWFISSYEHLNCESWEDYFVSLEYFKTGSNKM
jgi:ADP-ribose pyrophosphatase